MYPSIISGGSDTKSSGLRGEVAVGDWLKGPGEGVLCALSRRLTSGSHGLLSCVLVFGKDTEAPFFYPRPLLPTPDLLPSSSGLASALLQRLGQGSLQENTELSLLGPYHLLLFFIDIVGSCGRERRRAGQAPAPLTSSLLQSPFVLCSVSRRHRPRLLLSMAQMAALACLINCAFCKHSESGWQCSLMMPTV